MEKKNRYKNRIRSITLYRLALGGVLLLFSGASFVLVRNQHVIQGDEIRSVEDAIVELDREIELWGLRIAAVRDRQELSRRLRWVKSDLGEIDSSRVIEVDPATDVGTPVASAY
ncbi:MAG: hypothetical protein WD342_15115 [Verrucomicrobiales bacterium]